MGEYMRRFRIALVAFVLMLSGLGMAHATSPNVLLPDSNNDTSSSDDTTADVPLQSSDQSSDQMPNQTPPPGLHLQPMSPKPGVTLKSKSDTRTLPPTNVVKVNPPSKEFLASWGKGLPSTLKATLADSPVLGKRDRSMITKRIGISDDKVASACSIAMSGMIQTDKSSYMVPLSMASSHIAFKYDGKPKGARINITALCEADQLPAKAGIVMQINGKYAVAVAVVSCPVPEGQSASKLTVNYSGDGSGQCAYE